MSDTSPFAPSSLATEGFIKQELISYKVNETGGITKITVSRKFFKDGDYVDSRTEEVLSNG